MIKDQQGCLLVLGAGEIDLVPAPVHLVAAAAIDVPRPTALRVPHFVVERGSANLDAVLEHAGCQVRARHDSGEGDNEGTDKRSFQHGGADCALPEVIAPSVVDSAAAVGTR